MCSYRYCVCYSRVRSLFRPARSHSRSVLRQALLPFFACKRACFINFSSVFCFSISACCLASSSLRSFSSLARSRFSRRFNCFSVSSCITYLSVLFLFHPLLSLLQMPYTSIIRVMRKNNKHSRIKIAA